MINLKPSTASGIALMKNWLLFFKFINNIYLADLMYS